MMQRCLTCGGIYDPVGLDGLRYFHVCPPLVDATADTLTPRKDARNENAPRPAVLATLLAAIPDVSADGGHKARNDVADAAIVSAGAGVEPVKVDNGKVNA